MTAPHNPFRLDDARILVTGASRGIGAATAIAIARAGADTALSARTAQALKATAEQIRATGRRTYLIPGDFAQPETAGDVVDQAAEALGGLDIVVHAAGVLPTADDGTPRLAALEDSTPKEWERVLTVNLDATVALLRRARTHLTASPRAAIILISSVAGLMATPRMEAYAVTKAAQVSLTRSLAVDWARDNIRVNAVCPGWVATDMTSFATSSEPVSAWLMAHVPLGRWLTPEDVAHSVVYLASPAAACVTGHALVIDGALSIPDGGLAGTPKPPSPFQVPDVAPDSTARS